MSLTRIANGRGILIEEVREADLMAGDAFVYRDARGTLPAPTITTITRAWSNSGRLQLCIWTGSEPGSRRVPVLRVKIRSVPA